MNEKIDRRPKSIDADNHGVGRIEIQECNIDDVGHTQNVEPFVVRRAAREWPACANWTSVRFSSEFGQHEIDVWVTASASVWPNRRIRMRLGNYLDAQLRRNRDRQKCETEKFVPPDEKYYSGAIPVVGNLSSISSDVRFEEVCNGYIHGMNIWIGSAEIQSGFHWDGRDSWIAQVFGRKEIVVAAPDQARFLYPFPYDDGHNSRVNVANPDVHLHPLFMHACCLRSTLEPSDVVYVPAGWWHNLTSLDDYTVSANVWAGDTVVRSRGIPRPN